MRSYIDKNKIKIKIKDPTYFKGEDKNQALFYYIINKNILSILLYTIGSYEIFN